MALHAIWHEFPARQVLARKLADAIAAKLEVAIAERGSAVLVVSGGSTPGSMFGELSACDIGWDRVTVTLADERAVPPSSPRSNEHLVTRRLLQGKAARAGFIGLHESGAELAEAARRASGRIATLPRPFDVVVLGMGGDGHTASIFADAGNIADLVDPAGTALVLPVETASAPEGRLTLSLPLLAGARHVCMHIEGLEKKELLLDCLEDQLRPVPPIGIVLRHAVNPVEIYWAPTGVPS